MKLNVDNLHLDESGHILLGDQELESLERDFFVASAGGVSPDTTNYFGCNNTSSSCGGETNVFGCVNDPSC